MCTAAVQGCIAAALAQPGLQLSSIAHDVRLRHDSIVERKLLRPIMCDPPASRVKLVHLQLLLVPHKFQVRTHR